MEHYHKNNDLFVHLYDVITAIQFLIITLPFCVQEYAIGHLCSIVICRFNIRSNVIELLKFNTHRNAIMTTVNKILEHWFFGNINGIFLILAFRCSSFSEIVQCSVHQFCAMIPNIYWFTPEVRINEWKFQIFQGVVLVLLIRSWSPVL